MEQFQVVLPIQFHQWRNRWSIKLAIVGIVDTVVQLLSRKVI